MKAVWRDWTGRIGMVLVGFVVVSALLSLVWTPHDTGKIIPSDRAVYQSASDPNEVFPAWQCERCGYEQMSEKPKPAPKGKHK